MRKTSQVFATAAFKQGWKDAAVPGGRWTEMRSKAHDYEAGRLARVHAMRVAAPIPAPCRKTAAQHAVNWRETHAMGDFPRADAVVAKRAVDALRELCGFVPPRVPMASLRFKRGLPYVPTYAEVHGQPEAVPGTRRVSFKVPA